MTSSALPVRSQQTTWTSPLNMTQSSSVTGNRWTRVIHNYIFFTFILDTFGGPSTIMDTFGGYFWWGHLSCQVQQQATDQTKSAQQMLRPQLSPDPLDSQMKIPRYLYSPMAKKMLKSETWWNNCLHKVYIFQDSRNCHDIPWHLAVFSCVHEMSVLPPSDRRSRLKCLQHVRQVRQVRNPLGLPLSKTWHNLAIAPTIANLSKIDHKECC
jgi:hypothetical protein